MNIKWEKGVPAPVGLFRHTAVWLNGLVYVGGGYASYMINCYDPVKNSWRSAINTPYSYFAMTTLNKKLVTAGGKDRSDKITNQVFTMDARQLKNYTKMIMSQQDHVLQLLAIRECS